VGLEVVLLAQGEGQERAGGQKCVWLIHEASGGSACRDACSQPYPLGLSECRMCVQQGAHHFEAARMCVSVAHSHKVC